MMHEPSVTALIKAGQWISEKGWIPATGGDFSAKVDHGFIVTASGKDKSVLTIDDFLELNSFGEVTFGSGKPSAETALHLAVYAMDSSARFVLHTRSIATTVLSRLVNEQNIVIRGYEMQKSLSGITSHKQSVKMPLFENDTDIVALSNRVLKRHQLNPIKHCIVIKGHGIYTWGTSIVEARRHLEGLEFLFSCELERLKLGVQFS